MNDFVVESRTIFDGNGEIINVTDFTYDEEGNLLSSGEPFTGGILSNTGVTYSYDENNNLIEVTSIFSGSLSNGRTTIFTYDERNNVIRETLDTYIGFDPDGIDSGIIYTYDERNNLIEEVNQTYDSSGELTNSFTITYEYDENNNLLLKNRDDNSDGTLERQDIFTYDANNNLITESRDDGADEIIDSFHTYTYDENNNLIRENRDNNNDGRVDRVNTYTYDENNNLIEETEDSNNNGNLDFIKTSTYDNNNNLTSEIEDNDGDGIIDSRIDYTYDRNNNLIVEAIDSDGDGAIDRRIESDYLRIGESSEGEIDKSDLLLTDVHRFYHEELGFHFYSSDLNEINYVRDRSEAGELAYSYEAEQYQVLAENKDSITGEEIPGVAPVYRFFNRETGAHLYTTDENEKDSILNNLPNYNFEGIQYYAFATEPENLETIPVYRLLNGISGTHLFSSDSNEIDYIEENLSHFSTENNGNAVFYVFEL